MLKHVEDFREEARELLLKIENASKDTSKIFLQTQLELYVSNGLYHQWLQGYNDGFLDHPKKDSK